MNTQKMNLDFAFTNYPMLFFYILMALTVAYLGLALVQFLKFKHAPDSIKTDFNLNLLILIYRRLLLFGGTGFILSDILTQMLKSTTRSSGMMSSLDYSLNMLGWNNLGFGIIILFLGFGLGEIQKEMKKSEVSPSLHNPTNK